MSGVTLNVLISAALTGQPYNQQRLGLQAQRYARKITNRACPDFPEDRHDEVFQQAFVELFSFGAAALAGTTGQTLFRRAVFKAVRVVRSDYAPPGQRTRRPAKNAPTEPRRVAAEDVGRIATPQPSSAAPSARATTRTSTSIVRERGCGRGDQAGGGSG